MLFELKQSTMISEPENVSENISETEVSNPGESTGRVVSTTNSEIRSISTDEPSIEQCSSENSIEICVDIFGYFENPSNGQMEPVNRYSFTTQNRMTLQIITYNATITSIQVPNVHGEVEDILLGHDSLSDCIRDSRSFGALVDFSNNRTEFDVGNINWTHHLNKSTLTLTHLHNSDGNTANRSNPILFVCSFEVTAENSIKVSLSAHAALPTLINLGWNLFMNLQGHFADHIYNQVITLNIDEHITESNDSKIVKGTAEDLRTAIDFGTAIARKNFEGFDDNFLIAKYDDQNMAYVGRVFDAASGRTLEIYSTQPVVRLTTANGWPTIAAKSRSNWDESIAGIRVRFNQLVTADDGVCDQNGSEIAPVNHPIDFNGSLIDAKSSAHYKRHGAFSFNLLHCAHFVGSSKCRLNLDRNYQQITVYKFGLFANEVH